MFHAHMVVAETEVFHSRNQILDSTAIKQYFYNKKCQITV